MPIIFEKQINAAKKLAVWHITEPLDFFLERLGQQANEKLSAKRQLENSVCSVLLNELGNAGMHVTLSRDAFGKPYIPDASIAISFSHSKDMVACIIDTDGKPVGIDIELMRESIRNTSKKFINKDDTTPFEDLLHCHVIWGAKEVLYKIYARKELDFIGHLTVRFGEMYRGNIHKKEEVSEHLLDFTRIDDFILVWNV
jgi:4'-phosphopantetheinyl transferase